MRREMAPCHRGRCLIVAVAAMDDRVTPTAQDQPPIDWPRHEERKDERVGEAPPEQPVVQVRIHGARNDEHHRVVDDLHHEDRERVGGEHDRQCSGERHSRTQQWHEGEQVSETECERNCERDGRDVAPTERRSDRQAKYLADRASCQAMSRGRECQTSGAGGRFVRR